MTPFPNSLRVFEGGVALIDTYTSTARHIISLQYNPNALNPTLQPQAIEESADRSEALRSTRPPVGTIKRGANIDSKRQLPLKPSKP